MMQTLPKSKLEIRRTIDSIVYGNADKQTNWSDMIADDMLEKRHHGLSRFVSHGKGFNDSTKDAFCQLLGVEPTYTQKGIDLLIAQYCSIELDTLLLERKLQGAKHTERVSREALSNNFGNGKELVQWVKGLIEQGYTMVLTQKNKAYLVNSEGRGFDLKRTSLRKYAEALIQVLEYETQLTKPDEAA